MSVSNRQNDVSDRGTELVRNSETMNLKKSFDPPGYCEWERVSKVSELFEDLCDPTVKE